MSVPVCDLKLNGFGNPFQINIELQTHMQGMGFILYKTIAHVYGDRQTGRQAERERKSDSSERNHNTQSST